MDANNSAARTPLVVKANGEGISAMTKVQTQTGTIGRTGQGGPLFVDSMRVLV